MLVTEVIKQSFPTSVPLAVDGNSKHPAFPKLCSGKCVDVANTVIECLEDWNLTTYIQAMCFTTTSSNTGNKQGAYTWTVPIGIILIKLLFLIQWGDKSNWDYIFN